MNINSTRSWPAKGFSISYKSEKWTILLGLLVFHFSESIFAPLPNPSKLAKDMANVSDDELNKDHQYEILLKEHEISLLMSEQNEKLNRTQ